ncbi:hypothetical protein DM02DRAFT_168812 [Periconia macrospinosa]|uniref:Uncharacterized protein n=1 Tax=Periconia macrospinosa TaxID=97972 RepID=A0A2V1DAJ8_9PLEO|nr:hypothetical protein DM02DRAFT_168812 [Periconia macrospinosa]
MYMYPSIFKALTFLSPCFLIYHHPTTRGSTIINKHTYVHTFLPPIYSFSPHKYVYH